jgi:hypothetical protein
MIKTTNYEISKKLAEIGFRAECSYFYFHSDNNDYEASSLEEFGYNKISDCDIEDKYYPAYDLETLLEFAFDYISDFKIFSDHVFIADYWNDGKYEIIDELLVDREQSFKSVNGKVIREYKYNYAEIVAKLIILLYEKNLIKF